MHRLDFERARDFMYCNARLIERHLYSFHFETGSAASVLRALSGYRHDNGLYGFGLEPDKRTSAPQPVDQEIALQTLDAVQADKQHFLSICEGLPLLTNEDGALPFSCPTVGAAQHSPWWACENAQESSINPTGSIVAILLKSKVEHSWMVRAEEFCWRALDELSAISSHSILNALSFLSAHPNQALARTYLPKMRELVREATCFDPNANGYVFSPLIFAPDPRSVAAGFFSAAEIEPHLNYLLEQQQEDGGWPINWPPLSKGVGLEGRGLVTLRNLKILSAYGLLGEWQQTKTAQSAYPTV
ncbi:hypothetical protein PsAD2_04549 [Pseudovibrio axinellae]|uniref:Squalene cyclase C-terminal domain-containing protein n=1 Tax=Pseudovibrio axinellae TaxID=989403 RepID=A0A165SXU4_9HYPH|nr:hypothetical protein [Pseudovibrio axinellae]KZL04998.1 hypothetical protein PsAD2_04549 [Pseudovibrio axinellae]SER64240.1 hypothetical protein SAMN05421798_1152 [Pseudovibrio axinellae]